MKLNLGCGKVFKDGYVNIDIQQPCDLLQDLKSPLPFDSDSIDEVYSANFIHILSRKDWRELKKEIVRVLKPGGKCEITCHDFEYILNSFLEDRDGERWDWWLQTIFGAQLNEHDYIKNGFTYERLVLFLQEEGMINFERISDNPEYLHLVCYKP